MQLINNKIIYEFYFKDNNKIMIYIKNIKMAINAYFCPGLSTRKY